MKQKAFVEIPDPLLWSHVVKTRCALCDRVRIVRIAGLTPSLF